MAMVMQMLQDTINIVVFRLSFENYCHVTVELKTTKFNSSAITV